MFLHTAVAPARWPTLETADDRPRVASLILRIRLVLLEAPESIFESLGAEDLTMHVIPL